MRGLSELLLVGLSKPLKLITICVSPSAPLRRFRQRQTGRHTVTGHFVDVRWSEQSRHCRVQGATPFMLTVRRRIFELRTHSDRVFQAHFVWVRS